MVASHPTHKGFDVFRNTQEEEEESRYLVLFLKKYKRVGLTNLLVV